jgi:hypothetical protein
MASQKCKAEIISLLPHTHKANRSRIAKMAIHDMGLSLAGVELAAYIDAPEAALSNWHAVLYLTERCFPSPKLAKVINPKYIVESVIEEIVWESIPLPHE